MTSALPPKPHTLAPKDGQRAHFCSLFESEVKRRPSSPALHFQDRTLTYQALFDRATQLAEALKQQNIPAGSRIAVSIERGEDTIALLIAIWMCGCAYVPIDPQYPIERKQYILQNAQADGLVFSHAEDWHPNDILLMNIQDIPRQNNKRHSFSAVDMAPSDVAYVIFTSGSTGNPKGVVITQKNVSNFLLAMKDCFALTPSHKLLAVTTISFDIHVLELFLPLICGASIVIASRREAQQQEALQFLIEQHGITHLQATPSTWKILFDQNWLNSSPLVKMVGGEALKTDLRDKLLKSPGELWNMYGPTETTVWSTCHKITAEDTRIYIGTPIRNTGVHIVDEQLRPVEAEVAGELLISGDGVANGYFNNPSLTVKRFVSVVTPQQTIRAYRTGDRVILRSNGKLEYIDRLDNQIKLRGYRIEPVEIQQVLLQNKQIHQVEVVATQDDQLISCYTGEKIDRQKLRQFCASQLPSYMVPQHFVYFETFPLTENLKVDRNELAQRATLQLRNASQQHGNTDEPRDDLERGLLQVWSRTLGIAEIHIDDNFFDLGGHSLLALKASADTLKICGVEVSPTAIFSAPTIRQLRDSFDCQGFSSATILPLNQCQIGDPVFCLCGVQIYQNLADQFQQQRPVYGVFADIEASFLNQQEPAKEFNRELMDKLVEHYSLAIKRQNPNRTLSLIGLSFGGFVAMDVAKKLASEGYHIKSLHLIDSHFSGSYFRSPLKLITDSIKFASQNGVSQVFQKCTSGIEKARRKWFVKQPKKLIHELEKVNDIRNKAFNQATESYKDRIGTYNFDVHLIRTKGTVFGLGCKVLHDYGLSQMVTGGIHVSVIPGVHNEVMEDDNILALFHAIQSYENHRK